MAEAKPLVRGRTAAGAARLCLAAVALILAGCAAGGPAPAAPLAEAPAAPVDTVAGYDGAPLALSVWPAQGPTRAVLLAVHGFGDHAESTFDGPAPVWAAAGVAVYAYDQRGFGRNPSRRAWPGEGALIADFAAATAQVAARHPGVPLVALGHSMGAGVALAAVGEGRAPAVDALILAGPAVAGGDRIGPHKRAGLYLLAAAIPDRRFTGDGVVSFRPSDNAAALARMAADPLHFADPSPREIQGLVRVMDRAAAAAPAVAIPTLVLQGERDELVRTADVLAVAATMPGPVETILYPDGWHLLFRDLQRERVWADVRDWVLRRR